jgi:hypothetical protein
MDEQQRQEIRRAYRAAEYIGWRAEKARRRGFRLLNEKGEVVPGTEDYDFTAQQVIGLCNDFEQMQMLWQSD